jgi:transposase-like protein
MTVWRNLQEQADLLRKHRHWQKVIKNKASFPTPQAARKLLYLATLNITKKLTTSIFNWPLILNQLAIRFEDRWPQ